MVGASRLIYALSRDTAGPRGLGSGSRWGTPAWATLTVVVAAGVIVLLYKTAFGATAFDSFLWSGTIGTLILLVVYVLATIGASILVFVQHKLAVPAWQVVVPAAGIIVLGYTLYRNVIPWPAAGPPRWEVITSGVWLAVAIVAVLAAPGTARKLGAALTAREGIKAPDGTPEQVAAPRLATAGDEPA